MKLEDASLLKQDAWIAGRWTAAADGRRVAIRNPANGTVIGEVPMMGAVETQTAIEAAAAALPSWSRKTAKERAAILRRFADLMIANTNDLAIIMTHEQGKPLAEARAEIHYGSTFIEWFAEEAKRVTGAIPSTTWPDKRLMVLKQAIGVCVAITPWNFPSAMITRKISPALAAGCTIISRPKSFRSFHRWRSTLRIHSRRSSTKA